MEKEKGKSGLVVAGLVLGILGIVFSFVPIINFLSYIFGILAVIFAAVGLAQKKSKGMAIAALILGILSIAIPMFINKTAVDVLNEGVKEVEKTLNDVDGTNTDEILKNDLDVTLGELKITTDEYGLTDSKMVVTVKNKNDKKQSYSIHVEAVDASGNRIGDDYVYANDLGAEQTQEFEIFTYIADDKINAMKSAKFNIVDVTKA